MGSRIFLTGRGRQSSPPISSAKIEPMLTTSSPAKFSCASLATPAAISAGRGTHLTQAGFTQIAEHRLLISVRQQTIDYRGITVCSVRNEHFRVVTPFLQKLVVPPMRLAC
jgi:hypothetical protein